MRIELQNLRKSFGRTQVLRGVDLDLSAGKRVALIGPNGSGKSTLLRALLGLLSCDGTVLLDGRSPFLDRVSLAQELAYVPQVAPNLSASVEELLRTVAETRELDPAAISAVAERLELSVDEIRRRPFRNLSGGMKQKLLIALALAAKPRLIVLDEPTASLDARSRDRFFSLCEGLPLETTLILCSHRLEELRSLSDHVVMMAEGRVVFSGAASEFLARESMSVVEVLLDDELPDETTREAWLAENGFRTGAQGWWIRTVSQADKVRLLPELTRELGASLQNVLIHDLESIELPAAQEAHRHG